MKKTALFLLVLIVNVYGQGRFITGTPVNIESGTSTTFATSSTTASFTPPSNATIIAFSANTKALPGSRVTTATSTFSTVSGWTRLVSEFENSDGAATAIGIFTATTTGSPGSGTMTFNYQSEAARNAWIVVVVPQVDIHNYYNEVDSLFNESTTLSISMTDIGKGAVFLGGVVSGTDSDGITPGTNETELAEEFTGLTNDVRLQVQYGTDLTHNWSGLTAQSNCAVVVELRPKTSRRIVT